MCLPRENAPLRHADINTQNIARPELKLKHTWVLCQRELDRILSRTSLRLRNGGAQKPTILQKMMHLAGRFLPP